jgi:hypothetical protein
VNRQNKHDSVSLRNALTQPIAHKEETTHKTTCKPVGGFVYGGQRTAQERELWSRRPRHAGAPAQLEPSSHRAHHSIAASPPALLWLCCTAPAHSDALQRDNRWRRQRCELDHGVCARVRACGNTLTCMVPRTSRPSANSSSIAVSLSFALSTFFDSSVAAKIR